MTDQNEPEVQLLNLLSDENFGLGTFELTGEWIEEENRRIEDCQNLKFKIKRTKQLKAIARTGLANSVRRRYWFILSGGYDLFCRVGDIYEFALEDSKNTPINDQSSFGVTFNYIDFVPPPMADILPTFLHALWYHNQTIEYSPLVPAIATMLLMYMEPNLAYLSLQAIINKSKESLFYLLLNKKQFYASIEAVEKLIIIRLPSVANHAQKLGIDFPQLIVSISPSFFIPFISYTVSLTFFDSFISEGRKVFFRFLLQILFDEKDNLVNTTDSSEFDRLIFNAIDRLNNPKVMNSFLKKAFKLKMKRKSHIEKFEKMSSGIADATKLHLNFSQLQELLPQNSPRIHHRRTKTMDAKAKKQLNLLNLNDTDNDSLIFNSNVKIEIPKNSNARMAQTQNAGSNNNKEGGFMIIDGEQSKKKKKAESEKTTDSNLKMGSAKSSSSTVTESSSTNPKKANSNSNSNANVSDLINSSGINDVRSEDNTNLNISMSNVNRSTSNLTLSTKSSLLTSDSTNISLRASSGRIPSSILLSKSEIDSVRSIQAQIAARWLPLIHTHGETNVMLKEQMLLSIRNQLPPVFRLYSADLSYKMSVHGSYFASLFSRCNSRCQYILLIRTSQKLIGAFLSDPLIPTKNGRYYGTGMTMVFDLDKALFYKVKSPPKNDYFLSVSDNTIMIGGPDPAFYIQDGFRTVYSRKCETFNSPALTGDKISDEIVDLEVYRFIPQHYMRQRRRSINSIQKV